MIQLKKAKMMRNKWIARILLISVPLLFFLLFLPIIFGDISHISVIASNVVNKTNDSDDTNNLATFLENIPEYTGDAFVVINNNIPLFTAKEIESIKDIYYSELDELGRCGVAFGLIGPETIPTEKRSSIGDIKPSGWHTIRYDDRIEDRYLYNRCHLVGYQLAGANAEPRNLITGTRYLNMGSMLPLENAVWKYITDTSNHVLYRVTPIFEEDNLVASGLLMEAYSIEDNGDGVQFCRYLFNVQPGVIINYRTGDSNEDTEYILNDEPITFVVLDLENDAEGDQSNRFTISNDTTDNSEYTYVLNTNTMRFHDPSCPSVMDIKLKNVEYSIESRETLLERGYKPCGRCNP